MVRGPAPRLIAGPVPATVRLLPVTVAVWGPASFYSAWYPTSSVRSNNFPAPVRAEWFIEIAFAVNRHAHRYLGCACRKHRQRDHRDTAKHDSDFSGQRLGYIHRAILLLRKLRTPCCS